MDLDELKTAWRELDLRVQANEARSAHLLREVSVRRTRASLRRFSAGVLFEIVCGLPAVGLLGWFLGLHYGEAKFALPAVVLALAALFSLAGNLAQFVASLRVDYSAPVLEIQHRIALLRAARIRSTQFTLLFAPLLWTPLAIVAARGLLELDLYSTLGSGVIAANLAVGLAVIPLGIQAARFCAQRLEHSPVLKRLADCIAGYSLTRALESVDEIERFEGQG